VSRDQIVSLAVLGGMIFLFLWDRLRYDLVALLALLAAVLGGIVPADHAFSGFSNPVVPLIGGALIVSAAIARSGAVEVLVRWLTPLLRSSSLQVGVLVACVTALSAFVKNVGALAIFMPVAFQVARRNDRSPSEFLMPLAFASLLGGSMTLIGTSPNMLTATVRQQLEGAPFHMFDFFPVAFGTALCGVVFLSFGWRLIPRGRRSAAAEATFKIEDYTSELKVGPGSPFSGRTVLELEDAAGGDVAIVGIIRDEYRRYVPAGSWTVLPDDVLVVEADPQALDQFVVDGKLKVAGNIKADLDRLMRIASVLDSRLSDYRATLDGNEQYDDVEGIVELWRRIAEEPKLARLAQSTLFIEQPIKRTVALSRSVEQLAQDENRVLVGLLRLRAQASNGATNVKQAAA